MSRNEGSLLLAKEQNKYVLQSSMYITAQNKHLNFRERRLGEVRCIGANLATSAAARSSRQNARNAIVEEVPTRSVLEPLIGRTRG
jgi:hypothetical protein